MVDPSRRLDLPTCTECGRIQIEIQRHHGDRCIRCESALEKTEYQTVSEFERAILTAPVKEAIQALSGLDAEVVQSIEEEDVREAVEAIQEEL